MPSLHRRDKQRKMLQTIEDPELFATAMLGHRLWSGQRAILRSVAAHRRTAVKACHASGKTFTAAQVALWWITCHSEAVAVTTAPTRMQVERLLWGEIHKALLTAVIDYPPATATRLQLSPSRYAVGLATNEGIRFQGFHGNVLVILDEAPGIQADIWEAIEGICAGGDVRVLALGNPTIASGPFHEAFTSGRGTWNCITLSAFDTPNLEGLTVEALLALPEEELDRNTHPWLTTRRWVKEKYLEWGPGHPLWASRVLGNFPEQAEDALLSLAWLEAARTRTAAGGGKVCAGLDVAGPGEDETCLILRRGAQILALRSWADADPRGAVVAALQPYRGEVASINVDSIGVGWGMYQHLRDQFGSAVRSVNVGETARDPEKYANLKAELYWGLRMRAEAGDLSGLTDERAIGQLAGIRYRHNARGQVVIESKEEARKRGVKSPDRAEAIMLAFSDRSVRLGLIEYLKSEQQGQDKAAEQKAAEHHEKMPSATTLLKVATSENALTCPECQSSAVARIGAGYHCNQCGHQWTNKQRLSPETAAYEASQGQRRNLLWR